MPGVSSRLGLRENLEETIDFPMKYGGGSCKCSLKPIQWVFEGTMIRILLPSIMATCWIVFMIAENHNREIWTITCFRPHDICKYHLCISIFYIWSSLDPIHLHEKSSWLWIPSGICIWSVYSLLMFQLHMEEQPASKMLYVISMHPSDSLMQMNYMIYMITHSNISMSLLYG